jgi:hypothetical protein
MSGKARAGSLRSTKHKSRFASFSSGKEDACSFFQEKEAKRTFMPAQA